MSELFKKLVESGWTRPMQPAGTNYLASPEAIRHEDGTLTPLMTVDFTKSNNYRTAGKITVSALGEEIEGDIFLIWKALKIYHNFGKK